MQAFYILLIVLSAIHILIGCMLTKELAQWPKIKILNRILYITIVWIVPVVGSFVAYNRVKLNWFRKPTNEYGAMGGGFLEMDSFFNPAAKNVIDTKQDVKFEMVQSELNNEHKAKNILFLIGLINSFA